MESMIIYIVMLQYASISNGENILRILIRIYLAGGKKESSRPIPLSSQERYSTLSSIMGGRFFDEKIDLNASVIENRKRSNQSNITSIKEESGKELKPFIVADIETVIVQNIHKPYLVS